MSTLPPSLPREEIYPEGCETVHSALFEEFATQRAEADRRLEELEESARFAEETAAYAVGLDRPSQVFPPETEGMPFEEALEAMELYTLGVSMAMAQRDVIMREVLDASLAERERILSVEVAPIDQRIERLAAMEGQIASLEDRANVPGNEAFAVLAADLQREYDRLVGVTVSVAEEIVASVEAGTETSKEVSVGSFVAPDEKGAETLVFDPDRYFALEIAYPGREAMTIAAPKGTKLGKLMQLLAEAGQAGVPQSVLLDLFEGNRKNLSTYLSFARGAFREHGYSASSLMGTDNVRLMTRDEELADEAGKKKA